MKLTKKVFEFERVSVSQIGDALAVHVNGQFVVDQIWWRKEGDDLQRDEAEKIAELFIDGEGERHPVGDNLNRMRDDLNHMWTCRLRLAVQYYHGCEWLPLPFEWLYAMDRNRLCDLFECEDGSSELAELTAVLLHSRPAEVIALCREKDYSLWLTLQTDGTYTVVKTRRSVSEDSVLNWEEGQWWPLFRSGTEAAAQAFFKEYAE